MVKTQRSTDELKHAGDLSGSAQSTGRYVVTSSVFDFASFRERRRLDVGPGHAVDALAECLDAQIVQPGETAIRRIDRFASKIVGSPEQWSLARHLVGRVNTGDLVYATGDDAGLPIALTALVKRRNVKLAIFYTAPARFRPRTLTRFVSRLGIDLLTVAGADDKVEFLRSLDSGYPPVLASEQTDMTFFRPADKEAILGTSLITSCGLEQRDYATLTDAIEPLDVEVKICAVSPNFTTDTVVAMPDQLPTNVEMRRFDFSELRQLYQNAAVTVIPLLANDYSAGMTTMMEAIACGSPVVITANPGLASDFAARDFVIGVPPGDTQSLQRAIEAVLADPEAARARADRARSYVLEHHSSVRYVELLCGSLTVFHAT